MLILFFDLDQQEIFDNYKILINMGTFDLDFFLSSSHIHCTPHMKPEIQEPHIMISTYIRRNYTSKLSAIPVWSKTLGYTTVCGAGTQIHVTHHLLVLNMNTLTDYSVYEIWILNTGMSVTCLHASTYTALFHLLDWLTISMKSTNCPLNQWFKLMCFLIFKYLNETDKLKRPPTVSQKQHLLASLVLSHQLQKPVTSPNPPP